MRDVLLDVAPLFQLVGHASSAFDVSPELSAAFLQGQLYLTDNLRVMGNRLLRLRGERHPDRSDVDHHDRRSDRQRAPWVLESVVLPVGGDDGTGNRTGRLLVEQRNAVRITQQTNRSLTVAAPAVGKGHLDLEGVSTINRRRSRVRGVEVGIQDVLESRKQQVRPDGTENIGGGIHDLRLLDGVVELGGLLTCDACRSCTLTQTGGGANLRSDASADPAEVLGQKTLEPTTVGVFEHLYQDAQLDTVGVGLNRPGRGWKFLRRTRILGKRSVRRGVFERDVRIGDGGLRQILVNRLFPLHVTRFEVYLHACAVTELGFGLLFVDDLGTVAGGINLYLVVVPPGARTSARGDADGFARGQQTVHPRRRYPDALLTARHPQVMKLRTVKQLAEDGGNLRLQNPRTVIGDRDAKTVVRQLSDDDLDVGKDAGFLARVKSVIDTLLDGRQKRLARVIEAEKVTVLGEELRNRDVTLTTGHGLGVLIDNLECGSSFPLDRRARSAPRTTLLACGPGGSTLPGLRTLLPGRGALACRRLSAGGFPDLAGARGGGFPLVF